MLFLDWQGVKGFFNDISYFIPEFADYPSWL